MLSKPQVYESFKIWGKCLHLQLIVHINGGAGVSAGPLDALLLHLNWVLSFSLLSQLSHKPELQLCQVMIYAPVNLKEMFFYVSWLKGTNTCEKRKSQIMKNTMCFCVCVSLCKQRCWWLYTNDWAGVEAGLSTRLPAEFLKDPTDAIPNSLGRLLMLPGARLLPSPCTSSWPCCLSHTPPSMRASVWPSVCMCMRVCACATCRRSRDLGSHDKLLKRSLWTRHWQAPEPEGCTRVESNLPHSCSLSLFIPPSPQSRKEGTLAIKSLVRKDYTEHS